MNITLNGITYTVRNTAELQKLIDFARKYRLG